MHINDSVLLTPEEMGMADRAAIATGISGQRLMQAAGRAVADTIRVRWPPCPVVVLCGPGNNGGDGFVAARLLAEAGWPVTLGSLGGGVPLAGDAAYHAALWKGPVAAVTPELIQGAHLVVDALFGAGLSRDLTGAARATLQAVADAGIALCAIDVPSGLDGATGQVRGFAARADLTVTFFRKKPGHVLQPGRSLCGELRVADIGIPASVLAQIPAAAWENGPALWLHAYPWPGVEGHKYARGHVLVMGGALMTGAARLAARGAQRVGAGLVTVAAPAQAWAVYAAALTSIMVSPLHDDAEFAELLQDRRKNAIVIGPGAGLADQTRQHALAALATGRATVLDADAISVFGADPAELFAAIQGPCVLTPHEAEYGRLFQHQGSKLARARDAARQSGAVVLLKGSDTVIASPDGRAIVNTNAPPSLATGGSGDVLAGMIAGLMAQGMDAFLCAAAATWLHGQAAHRFGLGLVADDLPEMLPGALTELAALTRAS